MIEITILYPAKPGARFDHDYYETSHIPMALELLGPAVRRVTVTRGVAPGPPWPAPAYSAICRFECESVEAYQHALWPHLSRLQADLAAYSDCEPVVVIGEITLDRLADEPSGP
ncbi:EthD family reductase [Caulobacter sp. KR2-114]|uniref:EthD family reductase n=1 Tax=Caulobacter sp. KR2-114 TaxID=3400912 RepID=UPI003C014811